MFCAKVHFKSNQLILIFIFILLNCFLLFESKILGKRLIKHFDTDSTGNEEYSIANLKFFDKYERRIFQTEVYDHEAFHSFSLHLNINQNKDIILDLTLDTNSISDKYAEIIFFNGSIRNSHSENSELCHYQGKVRGVKDSWTAISTCANITGVIFDGFDAYNIIPGGNETYRLYKLRDKLIHYKCGTKAKSNLTDKSRSRSSRSALVDPYNSNNESLYIELVLVVDSAISHILYNDLSVIRNFGKKIVNAMNAIFGQINIFIILVGMEVWVNEDQFTIVHDDPEQTLKDFQRYRKEILNERMPNDAALLLTPILTNDNVAGLSEYNSICSESHSASIFSPVGQPWESSIIAAHELGHSLGILHDDINNCACPTTRCLMDKYYTTNTKQILWSSCSRDTLAMYKKEKHSMYSCLQNKPNELFGNSVCGNGFVEKGEECDCGLDMTCKSKCCDPETCRFQSNATCATGKCCNQETCTFLPFFAICRASTGPCDPSEYCTGQSEYCPTDIVKKDGDVCGMNGNSYCYKRQCNSHDQQCQAIWGPDSFSSNSQCYDLNLYGSRYGNCGAYNSSFVPCESRDKMCGKLFCVVPEEPNVINSNYIEKSRTVIQNSLPSGTFTSFTIEAIYNEGDNVDVGMVFDGTKCDESKICLNQKCIDVNRI